MHMKIIQQQFRFAILLNGMTSEIQDLSIVQKFLLFSKHRGFREAVVVSLQKLFFPLFKFYHSHFKRSTFLFDGFSYPYLVHNYNVTWISERAVEIPIFLAQMAKIRSEGLAALEIGNVLSHYEADLPAGWTIVDKYERAPGVVNEDISHFIPNKKYKYIVSVSTMEHVGFDEEEKDSEKIIRVVTQVQEKLLDTGGSFIFSVPIGFNAELDKKLFGHIIKYSQIKFLKRTGSMIWEDCGQEDVLGAKYNSPYAGGNALAVVYMQKQL